MTDKFADLTDSVGKISDPDQFMGSSFSIIISYLGKNNDSGSIFKVAGKRGIEVSDMQVYLNICKYIIYLI